VVLLVLLGLAAGAGFAIRPHVRAWYHRRAARKELQRYHNRQAIDHLLICRAIWPRDPETLLMSARAARRARVYGDSERLLGLYREIRGRDDAYTFEQLLVGAETRVDEFAVPCWKLVEDGSYDAPLLMEALTRGYLRQYRLGPALNCLERWKQDQPDNPQLFYLEGLFKLDYVHSSTGAVNSYRRAVELDEDHEEARLGLAVALMHDKNFAEAAEHFRRLLQGQPDNERVQVALAECLEGLGENAEALRLVDDVLAREPHMPAALSMRGQLALDEGQLAEAETWLRQALRGDPKDHRAHYSLILCLERSGQEEAARQQRQELQRLEKELTRFDQLVTKEMAERPMDPAVFCNIGQILLRVGKRDEGIRWLQNALELDRNYAPAREALAECMSPDRQGAAGKTAP
jgi:tetratricopeptide (TPR) repeat protein